MKEWLALACLCAGCAGASTSEKAFGSGGWAGGLGLGGSPSAGAAAGGRGEAPGKAGVLRDYLGDPAFPDDFWQTETFGGSGIDGAKLEQAVARIAGMGWEIHSFVVAHRGRLVLERYGWNQGTNPALPSEPHQTLPSEPHAIWSSTKSVLSALYGIALEEGAISSLDAPAVGWFADYESLNPSTEKSQIRLEDLLTMRSGLDLSEPDPTVSDAADPARAALARRMVGAPGETWHYSSGNSEILAEILRISTGRTPLEYADEKLFAPLGIAPPAWDAAGNGTQHGGFGLRLTARQMARFGELYRNSGRWLGTEVVPAAWVDESTLPRCPTEWGGEYAYHFWVPATQGLPGFFNTLGAWGQVIYVSREREVVIVFTAELPNETANQIFQALIAELVVPALP